MGEEHVKQEVETALTLSDGVTSPLNKVLGMAKKANTAFDKVSHTLLGITGIAGTLGAAFELHKAWEGANEYAETIEHITNLFEISAERADGLVNSMGQFGVKAESAQRIFQILGRRGDAFEQQLASGKTTLTGMAAVMKQLGITADDPEKAMLQLSKAVEKGKLDASRLSRTFGVPMRMAADMMQFLEQGPASIKKGIDELAGSGKALSAANLEALERMNHARARVSQGFQRMVLVVQREFWPAIEKVFTWVESRLPVWIDMAQRFGQVLTAHMGEAILLAKTFVTVMTTKKLLGVLGAIPGAGKIGGAIASRVVSSVGAGMAFGGLGPVAASFGALKAALITMGPIVLAVAAVVALLAAGFIGFQRNVGGIADKIRTLIESIKIRFQTIVEPFVAIWGALEGMLAPVLEMFGGDGSVSEFFMSIVPKAIEMMLAHVDRMLFVFQVILKVVGYLLPSLDEVKASFQEFMEDVKSGWESITNAFNKYVKDPILEAIDYWAQALGPLLKSKGVSAAADKMTKAADSIWQSVRKPFDEVAKEQRSRMGYAEIDRMMNAQGTAAEATKHKPPKMEMNFPNARFDITQKFAEGFDPDRIAVAFANDLASLGELKSQSGFSPVFAAH